MTIFFKRKIIISLVIISSISILFYEFSLRKKVFYGQVFIVTQGSQNIKLGLVDVIALPKQKFKSHIELKRARIELEKNKSNALLEKYSQSVRMENEVYESANDVFKKANNLLSDELISSGEGYEEIIKSAFQEINKKSKDREVFDDEINKLYAELTLKDEKSYLEYFFDGLVSDINSLTDADGAFSIELPAHGEFVVCAHATRKLYDATEEYFWVVSSDDFRRAGVFLSNNNLMSLDKLDKLVSNKEVIL